MLLLVLSLTFSALSSADDRAVSSLGRIEPHNGVLRLAGPSGGGGIGGIAVIKTLDVEEGDWVEAGQVVATLDNFEVRKAQVARLEAIVENAENELKRQSNLSTTAATSQSRLDSAEMDLAVARAELLAARAELDMARVRAPISGQVIKIHTYPGERVESDGILELAKTDRMYAVAEVYETDIARVREGQPATVMAPALAEPLTGTVERIALQVGRMDVLGTDPIAKTDARVVEVFILLDDSPAVAQLTNMQVEVVIGN
ncbi:transporter, MFP family [gamma proteobacterium NOR5-3]|nr:transporter, MFP family [gamma proteobacterium NOR5-3]